MLALLLAASAATHYSIQLRPDFEKKILYGAEEIEFHDDRSEAALTRSKAIRVTKLPREATLAGESVKLAFTNPGKQRVRFEYEAQPGPGFRWLDANAGLVTMFHCEAWMICDPDPGHRATVRAEFILPAGSGLRAVGPGRLAKQWRDAKGEHFAYERRDPAQTFLFSFAIARLERSAQGNFEIWAGASGHASTLEETGAAWRFFREKAGTGWADPRYTQVFVPLKGVGQEAAGMAIMSETYLAQLESEDSVDLMAHEMAHQWWAVLVGIRSWSDFWLNEGISEFMTAAFIEHRKGRAAYDAKMSEMRAQLEKLRAQGRDRPLHWEKWKDAGEALGPVPYLKGALFLDRLRTHLGEEPFWRGIALYTSRNAGKLTDSRDFQHAMEQASGRSLAALFEEGVYR